MRNILTIISVVLNSAKDLENTILSVICQKFKNYEYIIIDGGSTDGTIEIIKKYEKYISYWISEYDNGIYDAMNKGASHAHGTYLNFLNAGDYYCDEHILSNVFNDENINAQIIYGDFILIDQILDTMSYVKSVSFNNKNVLKYNSKYFCHQSFFVKKDIFIPYDTSYHIVSDLNWYLDLLDKTQNIQCIYIEMPIVIFALGGFNSNNANKGFIEWIRLLAAKKEIISLVLYVSIYIDQFFQKALVKYRYLNRVFKLLYNIIKKVIKFFVILLFSLKINPLLNLLFSGYLFETNWYNVLKYKKQYCKKDNIFDCLMSQSAINIIADKLYNNNIIEINTINSIYYNEFYNKKNINAVCILNETMFKKRDFNRIKCYFYEDNLINIIDSIENIKYNILIMNCSSIEKDIYQILNILTNDAIICINEYEYVQYYKNKEFYLELKARGYKNLSFWGISPGGKKNICTMLYYKENNCLDI